MSNNGQQYIDRLKSLEETIAEDEPKLIQLEKYFKEKEEKYNYWKTSYSNDSDDLSKKGCFAAVIAVVVFFIFMFSGVLSSALEYLVIFALGVIVYFLLTWDDRDSRNSSKKFLDDYEKEYNKIKPQYEELKKKHDSDKNQYAALQNEYKIWKERREELIHSLTGIKPYEYMGFPLDPVINMSYYPLGNIDNPQKYIVYTANAHRYHKKYGCSGAYEEISISEALDTKLTPCYNCFRYRDFDYPDWVHTVHDKYLDFVTEAKKHDINVFIDSNRQLSVELPSTGKIHKVPPPVPAGIMICPACDKMVSQSNYCPECGHKMEESHPTSQEESNPTAYLHEDEKDNIILKPSPLQNASPVGTKNHANHQSSNHPDDIEKRIWIYILCGFAIIVFFFLVGALAST